MKLGNLFSNLYWKKKYNTLENKYETEKYSKTQTKDKLLELQDKYISALEKMTDIDKLQKDLNKKINELEMKGKVKNGK